MENNYHGPPILCPSRSNVWGGVILLTRGYNFLPIGWESKIYQTFPDSKKNLLTAFGGRLFVQKALGVGGRYIKEGNMMGGIVCNIVAAVKSPSFNSAREFLSIGGCAPAPPCRCPTLNCCEIAIRGAGWDVARGRSLGGNG